MKRAIMNVKTEAILGIVGSLALLQNQAIAGTPMMVNPSVSSRPGAPASGTVARSGTSSMTVRLVNSCYGTNLRGTSNPLAPSSLIETNLTLKTQKDKKSAAVPVKLMLKYPGFVADKDGFNVEADKPIDKSMYSGPEGTTMRIFGNTVEAIVPMPVDVTVQPDGTVDGAQIWPVTIESKAFKQHVTSCEGSAVYGKFGKSSYTPTYPCGNYMGKNGDLSHQIENVSVSSDNSVVEISVKFPGQTGFCGGYYSPLMVFFDEARPKFNGSSEFKLSASKKTYWVEAGAPGYFLAVDRNKNKKIDHKVELFGDQDSEQNGFDSLREFDSNNDGEISRKDKGFESLVLWQDKNGDGKTDDGEMEALGKRVTRISLGYERRVASYGDTAEARQNGKFWFKEGKQVKQGVVEDIWFAPAN
jgi:hypothetical protein